ncbi:MAG: hypothetical protein ABI147_13295 [Acidobacteriaceae bacterium]
MWPKAILQLAALLPHVSRLVPMADKFFQSRNAGEEANRKALEAMADSLHSDLTQLAASHAALCAQLNDQTEKLAQISVEARTARAAAESAKARVAHLEKRLDRIGAYLLVVTVLALGVLVLYGLILSRIH